MISSGSVVAEPCFEPTDCDCVCDRGVLAPSALPSSSWTGAGSTGTGCCGGNGMAVRASRWAGGCHGAIVVLAVEVCVMATRVMSMLVSFVSLLCFCLKQLGSSLKTMPPMISIFVYSKIN